MSSLISPHARAVFTALATQMSNTADISNEKIAEVNTLLRKSGYPETFMEPNPIFLYKDKDDTCAIFLVVQSKELKTVPAVMSKFDQRWIYNWGAISSLTGQCRGIRLAAAQVLEHLLDTVAVKARDWFEQSFNFDLSALDNEISQISDYEKQIAQQLSENSSKD